MAAVRRPSPFRCALLLMPRRSLALLAVAAVVLALGPAGSWAQVKVEGVPENWVAPLHDKCEVCRLMVRELEWLLEKTKDSKERLDTGARLDGQGNWRNKKKIPYSRSEFRLMEAMEQVCAKMNEYSTRWDDSRTERSYFRGDPFNMNDMKDQLGGLGALGLNLGPQIEQAMQQAKDPFHEKPSLISQCQAMVEETEYHVTKWYLARSAAPLTQYLCIDRLFEGASQCQFYDDYTYELEEPETPDEPEPEPQPEPEPEPQPEPVKLSPKEKAEMYAEHQKHVEERWDEKRAQRERRKAKREARKLRQQAKAEEEAAKHVPEPAEREFYKVDL